MKILCLLILVSASLVSCDRIVQTNNGPVRGKSVAGGKVEAFLGIPYAEPPVGPLRFAKPVPKSSWEDTLEANSLPPYCVQCNLNIFHFPVEQSGVMSEDCLFLNLWVPEGGSDQKPIMLFVHGGGFMFGSSIMKLYDGSNLSERGDVIVATINYRVGTLGFFFGFTEEAAGNMGMYDQVMAIQWIKDNARHFRGDADNIVLFGESAGSFSVSLHMVSPLSRKLFRRGILQSGSAIHPAYSENNTILAHGSRVIANLSGCLEGDALLETSGKTVVDCLKNFPAEKIAELDLRLFQSHGRLLPRVGDDFLPESPLNLYRKGNFNDDEILIGVTRDEGSILLVMKNITEYGLYGDKVNPRTYDAASAMGFMKAMTTMYGGGGADPIVRSYLNHVKDVSRYSYLHAASDFMGDFIINCGSVFQADFQSLAKNTNVYFYVFDYRPASTPLAEWMGVAHLDEVQYVFGNPMYANFTMFEEEFSKDVMDMWIAFAKNGNPSTPGGVKWPRYTAQDPKYYVIGKTDGVGVMPLNGRCEVWRNLFRAAMLDEEVCKRFCKKWA